MLLAQRHLTAVCDEFETKSFEQALSAIEEQGKRVRSLLDRQGQVATEWRQLALDAARHSQRG